MTALDTTYCQASLNYSDAAGYQPRVVAIADGRADPETRDFDRCGFELLQHSSAVVDWRDEQELTRVHGPECEKLVSCLTNTLVLRTSSTRQDKAHAAGNIWILPRRATRSWRVLDVPEGRARQGPWLRCSPCQYGSILAAGLTPCQEPCRTR